MEKLFYEKYTGKHYSTLKAAKEAARNIKEYPYVSRVWVDKGKLLGICLVYAYGESVCTIKDADTHIRRKLNRKDDGKDQAK